MRALTIGDLERLSGVPRSTIYYYVRAGLLPPAQKSSPTRALYTDDHLELLQEIGRLKQQGLDLNAIRDELRHRVVAASENGADLVAWQGEETRRAILRTAAREFSRNGYRQTRIADIIAKLGITPQVLYSHYPTKRDLFAACFREYLEGMMEAIEAQLRDEPDLAVHHVWRMHGDYGCRAFNPDLIYLTRDAAYDDPETTKQLRGAYEQVLLGPQGDLERLRQGPDDPPISDELMSFALFGAFQTMRMRASWDDRFTRKDVMWTNIALLTTVLGLYEGKLDVVALKQRYESLIDEVCTLEPPVPPGFEEVTAGPEREP